MADWKEIKTEYITTDTSYRKLAQKHGVNVTNIAKKASAEGWVEQRKQYTTTTQAKTLAKISQQEAARAAKIHNVADKLLLKIEAMVESGRPLDTKGIRALTAAVKDLKEIQSVRSELDLREQEARIDKLRKEAADDSSNKEPIKVILGDGLDKYSM